MFPRPGLEHCDCQQPGRLLVIPCESTMLFSDLFRSIRYNFAARDHRRSSAIDRPRWTAPVSATESLEDRTLLAAISGFKWRDDGDLVRETDLIRGDYAVFVIGVSARNGTTSVKWS